jgi:hypothetical protein
MVLIHTRTASSSHSLHFIYCNIYCRNKVEIYAENKGFTKHDRAWLHDYITHKLLPKLRKLMGQEMNWTSEFTLVVGNISFICVAGYSRKQTTHIDLKFTPGVVQVGLMFTKGRPTLMSSVDYHTAMRSESDAY